MNPKADTGKPRISLVPPEILNQVAKVMMYGEEKYGAEHSWRDRATKQQYVDAFARHAAAFWADPDGVDDESGLPHIAHVASNVAFLCELMYGASRSPQDKWVFDSPDSRVGGGQLLYAYVNGKHVGNMLYEPGCHTKYRLLSSREYSMEYGGLDEAREALKREYYEVYMK